MQRSVLIFALPLCGVLSVVPVMPVLGQTANLGPATAATTAGSGNFRAVLELAWSRQPAARTAPAKADEFSSRRKAAEAFAPDAPSLTLAHRTDAVVGRNLGQREFEAEVAVPLWQRGARAATRQAIIQDEGLQDALLALAKWKLAGEVREAIWNQRLAANDVAVTTRREAEAASLAVSVERRVKAGDLALVDLNQALVARAQAQAALAEAHVKSARAMAGLRAWGIGEPPAGLESLAVATGGATNASLKISDSHAALTALRRQIEAARARMGLARATAREPMEVALGLTRERGIAGDPYNTSARVALKIPFGGEARNGARIAQANSEMVEAEALLAQERLRLETEGEAAQAELNQTRSAIVIATERARLSAQSQALFDKAFQLGEIELATRLRAENERFDADLALSRATVEAGRAISRFNQILGILP